MKSELPRTVPEPTDPTESPLNEAERATETVWWRSLAELEGKPALQSHAETHLESAVRDEGDSVDRRSFLELMGASMALAGLGACTAQPNEKILPYARTPEATVPGRPLFYATSMSLGGSATGLLVESHDGRPTKIEGNPLHPSSLGATDAICQAAILGLYDPNRSQTVKRAGRIDSWAGLLTALKPQLDAQRAKQGAGLRVLSQTIGSPTLHEQRSRFLAAFPQASWVEYEPVTRDNAFKGLRLAYGREMRPHYDLSAAQVIVSLESDLLGAGAGHVAYARQFAKGRKAGRDGNAEAMNRLYALESTPTITGVAADHRFVLRPAQLERCAQALAQALGVLDGTPESDAAWDPWLATVARDLRAHAGRSLLVAGEEQSARVHGLCAAINERLGNVGQTVFFTEPEDLNYEETLDWAERPSQAQALGRLSAEMAGGAIDLLLILEGNPAYDAPAGTQFAERLDNVALTVHLSLYEDETSELCRWHVPAAHFLESWSDARGHDTTASIVQPLIAPLYAGKTAHELVSLLIDESPVGPYDQVRGYWSARARGRDFDKWWARCLHDGIVEDSKLPLLTPYLREDFAASLNRELSLEIGDGIDMLFRPDSGVWDGRFADNGWLQELPKPITKLTWGNAALLSPLTAERLGVENGELLALEFEGAQVEVPAWLLPGQAEDCITLGLGFGRRFAGKVGRGVGVDVQPLRRTGSMDRLRGSASATGRHVVMATTQEHHSMEGRDLVRVRDVRQPVHEKHASHGETSIYPPYEGGDYAWGMVFDLGSCLGCNACVVSCQSENNIPVVGQREVARGREMQWIRIDRYWEGGKITPKTHFQPIACMHCETAPCEVVCPVGATTHSPEGLNEMTYNRCVGTRYCSNNCPYKVRRFNFFKYSDTESESLKLGRNPDVTVRTRGVMEKCTYCVQRINQARIEARREGRAIEEGQVVTACQAACPSEAIFFGDLSNPESSVSKLAANPHNYGLLTELNTKPRTTYLARVQNPNPELADLGDSVREGADGH